MRMDTSMKKEIRVFIASPGDLTEERKKFRETIQCLNDGFGDGANVEYMPLGWEEVLASTGRRPQQTCPFGCWSTNGLMRENNG